eukprot:TRINITY_DN696_c1_g1_i2.p1 TRINITY_DN696_c1_g1~~TRINITY_DN696_c1_g1_i2.p1  ORF type:complete len:284 (+),score=60.78 TRINITY_DN696_c1_g1_i2:64-915(+)
MIDPEQYLPIELFTTVVSFLNPKELATCAQVNTGWCDAATDKSVWQIKCKNLWADKKYVSPQLQHQMTENPRQAYKDSLNDCKRAYVTMEELCGFTWNFRFKESAGYHWTENDPWWQGKSPIQMKFLENGQTIDNFWQNHGRAIADRRWRFIERAAGRAGPTGSFIQVNNFPPYVVSRTKDWGFVMQSCWVVYTSFPMPPLGQCPALEDEALEITTEVMRSEAMMYNIGVEFPGQDNNGHITLLQLFAQLHQNGVIFDDNDMDDEDEDDMDQNDDEDADVEEP